MTTTMGADSQAFVDALCDAATNIFSAERRKRAMIEVGTAVLGIGLALTDSGMTHEAERKLAARTQPTAAAPRVQQRRARRTPAQMSALSPGVAVPKKRARRTKAQMEADRARQGNGYVPHTEAEQIQPAAE